MGIDVSRGADQDGQVEEWEESYRSFNPVHGVSVHNLAVGVVQPPPSESIERDRVASQRRCLRCVSMRPRARKPPSPGPFPAIFFLSRAARGSWNNHHDRTMLTAFANRVTQVGITPDRASCCCMGARLAARLAAAAAARGAASCRASMADVWQL